MNYINPADLSALQHINRLLTARFAQAKSEQVRQLWFKQMVRFLDLAIKLNQKKDIVCQPKKIHCANTDRIRRTTPLT